MRWGEGEGERERGGERDREREQSKAGVPMENLSIILCVLYVSDRIAVVTWYLLLLHKCIYLHTQFVYYSSACIALLLY